MEFEELSEAGTLQVDYDGRALDTYALGVIHLNLHEMYEKVAWGMLEKEFGWPDVPHRRWRWHRHYRWLTDQRLVRAEIRGLRSGSLYETAAFLIPVVLADPDVRAVLQNLVANIIYEIGATRLKGVRKDNQKAVSRTQSRLPPMFDPRNNVRQVIQALGENGGGKVRFTHKSKEGESTTVVIEVASEDADD